MQFVFFEPTMSKSLRYRAAKYTVEKGDIKTLNDLFEIVSKTKVSEDLGYKNTRFTELLENVERFTLEQLFDLGKLFELDEKTITDLACNEYLLQKEARKKNMKQL